LNDRTLFSALVRSQRRRDRLLKKGVTCHGLFLTAGMASHGSQKTAPTMFHARFEAVTVLRESDPTVTLTSKVRFLGKSSKKMAH
jgi:hypothetical protein